MSNTSMQRRVEDYRLAGLNPVLAAGGPGASTPSLSPATVEPTYKNDLKGSVGNAMMLKTQMDNVKANTAKTLEEARVAKVTANNAEIFGPKLAEWEATKRFQESEGEGYVTKRKEMDAATAEITRDMSAKQLEQFQKMMPELIAQARQMTKEGKINLEALENIAKVGGIEAGRAQPFIKMILDLFMKPDVIYRR